MRNEGLQWILDDITNVPRSSNPHDTSMQVDEPMVKEPEATSQPKKTVDLEALSFTQGSHLMSNKECKLPKGSTKKIKKNYEEVHVPAPKQKPFKTGEKLKKIKDLPLWAQAGFPGADSLNRVQSQVYQTAFLSDENMLLCAPTGAGK
jgi:pre-mRNA-splicing helicase BRR2